MVAFPQQNIYNHLFQPLWKAPQKKKCYGASNYYGKLHQKKNQKTKNKKGYGASGRRSVMTMLLHKSDKKYQTLIEICIMSWLEINISLPHPGRPKPLDVQNTGCPKTMDVQNPGCQNPGCPKPRCPNPGCLSVVQTMYVQTMDDTLPLACVCTFFLVTPVINNTPAQNKASH